MPLNGRITGHRAAITLNPRARAGFSLWTPDWGLRTPVARAVSGLIEWVTTPLSLGYPQASVLELPLRGTTLYPSVPEGSLWYVDGYIVISFLSLWWYFTYEHPGALKLNLLHVPIGTPMKRVGTLAIERPHPFTDAPLDAENTEEDIPFDDDDDPPDDDDD